MTRTQYAKVTVGRMAGLFAALGMTIAGALITLFAIRLTQFLDLGYGLGGIAVWILIGGTGLILGTLGILGLITWTTSEVARRRARH